MSESPDQPSTPPESPEPEHHGLGEELRRELHHLEEKVEEVVEHVPQPVRWTIGKIVLLASITLFGLVVLFVVTAVLYVANRTEWAAQELTVLVNQTLASRTDLEL